MKRNLLTLLAAVFFIACAVGYEKHEENSTMTWDTSNYDSNIRVAHLIDFKGKFIAIAFNFQDRRLIVKISADKGKTWSTVFSDSKYKKYYNTTGWEQAGKTDSLIWFYSYGDTYKGYTPGYIFWSTDGCLWRIIDLDPVLQNGFGISNLFVTDDAIFLQQRKSLDDAGGTPYGHTDKVIVSHDKGNSWQTVYLKTSNDGWSQTINIGTYFSQRIGIIIENQGDFSPINYTIKISFDKGKNFIDAFSGMHIFAFGFTIEDGQHLCFVSQQNQYTQDAATFLFLLSHDRGRTWHIVNATLSIPLHSPLQPMYIRKLRNLWLFFVDNKCIAESDNYGETWTAAASGRTNIADNFVYVGTTVVQCKSAGNGVDFFISDYGRTWIQERLPRIHGASAILYDGYITIVGGEGTIRGDGPDFIGNASEPSKLRGCDTTGSEFAFAQFKPDTFVSPLHLCNSDGNINTIALVNPISKIASRFIVKINPESDYAKMILGKNNDGICMLAKYQ
ncbi:hypothetical protein IZU27_02705 [Treponema socranskii]|uniref:hypothetical protein n=1 Tax=Treponema socranskii TaxID=53419 RepID=UPI003D907ABE